MSGPLLGVAGIAVMFAALFLLRIPAGFTMAIVGFFGIVYATSFTAALGMIGGEMWNIFSGYGLTVIPMFILVGEFVHYAGYNDSLYHATNRWFGHYRGGWRSRRSWPVRPSPRSAARTRRPPRR